MKELGKNMGVAAAILGAFFLVCSAVVAFTYLSTKEPIALSEKQALLERIQGLIPKDRFDNDITQDVVEVTDQVLLGTKDPVKAYRARKAGQPVAVLLAPVAPDGYSGAIKLLVAILADGTVAGVRVVTHKETPGLGDYIEDTRSDWIHKFDGKALGTPPEDQWKVKKDGGVYDHITGATITPRAVVKAVKNSLKYFQAHRDELFAPATAAEGKR